MEFLAHYFLTTLIFLPAIGAAAILALRRRRWTRWIALGVTVATFAMALSLLMTYDWHSPGHKAPPIYACRDEAHPAGVVQLVQRVDLIPAWHIQYFVGIDGLSLPLVVLAGFIGVRMCVAGWGGMSVSPLPRQSVNAASPSGPRVLPDGDVSILLCLESLLLGTFLSLNFVLFFFFFAVSILPIVVLLRRNVVPRNRFAAIQFSAAMLLGILLLLIAMVAICMHAGSLDLIALPAMLREKYSGGRALLHPGNVFFLLLMASFIIRLPVFPLHRWLTQVYVEAPAPLGMMASALLLATGGYGILRIAYPLFPAAGRSCWLVFAIIGVVNILYGALAAIAQQTFRRLIACISIFQMGLFLLGIAMLTPASVNGAVFMLVAHGITSAMLMALAGILIDRFGHDDIGRLGGAARSLPGLCGTVAFAFLAVGGLPMLCGFVAEILVLAGTFQAANFNSSIRAGGFGSAAGIDTIAILGCVGTLLFSIGLPWKFQQMFLGSGRNDSLNGDDLRPRDITLLTPMMVAILLLGILPMPLYFSFTRTTLQAAYHLAGLH